MSGFCKNLSAVSDGQWIDATWRVEVPGLFRKGWIRSGPHVFFPLFYDLYKFSSAQKLFLFCWKQPFVKGCVLMVHRIKIYSVELLRYNSRKFIVRCGFLRFCPHFSILRYGLRCQCLRSCMKQNSMCCGRRYLDAKAWSFSIHPHPSTSLFSICVFNIPFHIINDDE